LSCRVKHREGGERGKEKREGKRSYSFLGFQTKARGGFLYLVNLSINPSVVGGLEQGKKK